MLAALTHPNIGAIYGLEEGPQEDGSRFRALVLELVEGETLADRIAKGAGVTAMRHRHPRQAARADLPARRSRSTRR